MRMLFDFIARYEKNPIHILRNRCVRIDFRRGAGSVGRGRLHRIQGKILEKGYALVEHDEDPLLQRLGR